MLCFGIAHVRSCVNIQNIIFFCTLLFWCFVKGFYVACPNMFPTRDQRYEAGPPRRPDEGIHIAEPPLFSIQWGSSATKGNGFVSFCIR